MTDIKKIYRLSFSRAAKTYEEEAHIQRQTAEIISKRLKFIEGLGLDCGSGTCFINQLLPNKRMVNLDISKSMAKMCRDKGFPVVVADIESIPFRDAVFDFSVSNFTLHWTNLELSFPEIARVLKPGAYFLFSIPVDGSLRAIQNILGKSFFHFYSPDEIKQKVSRHFSISEVYTLNFEKVMENGLSLLRHLHLTGSLVNPEEISLKEKLSIFKKFAVYTEEVVLNFNVAFFQCVKL